MRTLSAALITAQQGASVSPYVTAYLKGPNAEYLFSTTEEGASAASGLLIPEAVLSNSSTKIYSCGLTDTPPAANWMYPNTSYYGANAYDDSAWPAATEHGDHATLTGAKIIWDAVVNDGEYLLTRITFQLTAGFIKTISLAIRANVILEAYLNGILLSDAIIPNHFFIDGVDNVLAIKCKATAADAAFDLSYSLSVSRGSNRIFYMEETEEPWRSKSILQLKNDDAYFSKLNLEGFRMELSWGATTAVGNQASKTDPKWVFYQQDLSQEGELITEFVGFNIWERLANDFIISGGSRLNGDIYGEFNFAEVAITDTGSCKILYQGYQYVTVTDVVGTFSPGQILTGQTLGGKMTIATVELSNGVGAGPGWLGTTSIQDILGELIVSNGYANMQLTSEDTSKLYSGTGTPVYLPYYTTQHGVALRTIIKELMDRTKNVLRVKAQDLTPFILVESFEPSTVADYTYYLTAAGHKFFTHTRGQGLLIPNKIYVVGAELDITGVRPVGYILDTDSISRIGTHAAIVEILLKNTEHDAAVQEAVLYASALIEQQRRDTDVGHAIVPMNCGQELFDYVKVVDTRLGSEVSGWVTQIRRVFRKPNSFTGHTGPDMFSGRDRYAMSISIGRSSWIAIDRASGVQADLRLANRFQQQPKPIDHGNKISRPIDEQIVISTVADMWGWDGGVANATPPPDYLGFAWYVYQFDHVAAGWPDAVAGVAGTDPNSAEVAGSQKGWYGGVGKYCYTIQTFNVDEGEATGAFFEIRCDDKIHAVYINGIKVWGTVDDGLVEPPLNVYIPAKYLYVSGSNKIAVLAQDTNNDGYFISYKLTINRVVYFNSASIEATQLIGIPPLAVQQVIDHVNLASIGTNTHAVIDTHIAAVAPHTGHVNHSLATAISDFLVASGAGAFVKKTLAEVKTLLGLAGTVGGNVPASSAAGDFLTGDAATGNWLKSTLDGVKTLLGLGTAAYTASTDYAPTAKGVTGGDTHDHVGGDGAVIPNAALAADVKPAILATPTLTGLVTVSGGQIAFPAAQSASANANTLDDYEEGTWTPSIGGDATYHTQIGKYTKIGNGVILGGTIKVNILGTGSTTDMTGVPFAAADVTAGTIGYWSSIATAVTSLMCIMITSSIRSRSVTAAGISTAANPLFKADAEVNFAVTYST